MSNDKKESQGSTAGGNGDLQGVDKAPGEEQGKQEKVTMNDLKGKKVDADTDLQTDKPEQQ